MNLIRLTILERAGSQWVAYRNALHATDTEIKFAEIVLREIDDMMKELLQADKESIREAK